MIPLRRVDLLSQVVSSAHREKWSVSVYILALMPMGLSGRWLVTINRLQEDAESQQQLRVSGTVTRH